MELPTSGDIMMLGGVNTTAPFTDCWRSRDGGLSWAQVTADGVPGSRGAVIATASGSLLLTGGLSTTGVFLDDVWRSAPYGDCRGWTLLGEPSWSARRFHQAILLSDGAIMVAGGQVGADIAARDIHVSRDDGVSWTVVNAEAEWPARKVFGMVELPDGGIVVAGGMDSLNNELLDVWVSRDQGVSFTQQPTPVWSASSLIPLVVRRGTLMLLGARSGGTASATVFASGDAGATWSTVDADFHPRTQSAAVVTRDGTVLLFGGSDGNDLSDLWQSESSDGVQVWRDARCTKVKRALCTALPSSVTVAVTLPAHAGTVSPPNGGPVSATAVVRPPLPVIKASNVAALVHTHVATFRIGFSTSVVGLVATDFDVALAGAQLASRELWGQDANWELTVTIDTATVRADHCPTGFTMDATGQLCARSEEVPRSWYNQRAACAPFELAVLSSEAALLHATSMQQSKYKGYWCVWRWL